MGVFADRGLFGWWCSDSGEDSRSRLSRNGQLPCYRKWRCYRLGKSHALVVDDKVVLGELVGAQTRVTVLGSGFDSGPMAGFSNWARTFPDP